MPSVPKKQCNHSGCKHLQPCPIHPKKAWTHNKPVERMRGRVLQRERERLFNEQPLCAICQVRATMKRDHIVPLAEGGTDDADNTQGLCSACHKRKTQQEARRGKRGGVS